MAIVTSMWLRGTKQKLGGSVLYQAMGQTRQRELAANVSNPRTQAQMEKRTRWANLVNFYRANAGWMKFAYETKKTNQSEYNKFMSLNVPGARIYLPKTIANQGGCIVDAYQMTQGSLASVEFSKVSGGWNTNIFLNDPTNLDEYSTVGEWTRQILPVNPALREGDQLSFVRFTQQTNSSTGVPFVVVRKYEVVLNSNDVRRFSDFMPMDYIGTGTNGDFNCIAIDDSGNAGGFLMCISRTIGGKTYVSTQSIVVANNSTLIEAYSSQAAMQAAVDSYGESTEPFLTSTTAGIDENAPVAPSALSVKIGTTSFAAGEVAYIEEDPSSKAFKGYLSGAVEGVNVSVWAIFMKSGQESEVELTSASVSGNVVSATFPANLSAQEGAWLTEVSMNIDGARYRCVFGVPNEATIEGLE